MDQPRRYSCLQMSHKGFPAAGDAVWDAVPLVSLVDTVSGQIPVQETHFQLFRDDAQACFFVRFTGMDQALRSDFRWHDEPLWQQDVLELFLADEEGLQQYKEIQASLWDVHLDGIIRWQPDGSRHLDLSWDIPGFLSRSRWDARKRTFYSVWRLPYAAFSRPPAPGGHWRFNAYRIDHSEAGQQLLAWQKTGRPDFHVPECFGYLDFDA